MSDDPRGRNALGLGDMVLLAIVFAIVSAIGWVAGKAWEQSRMPSREDARATLATAVAELHVAESRVENLKSLANHYADMAEKRPTSDSKAKAEQFARDYLAADVDLRLLRLRVQQLEQTAFRSDSR